ncbi:hypothetical protein Tco_0385905 [Tanacetum coccineum]
MICNMDSIGKYMLEIILHQQQTSQLLTQKKLIQTQDDHSNIVQEFNVDSLKVDLVVIQNTCSEKEDSDSKTASSKSVKESSSKSGIGKPSMIMQQKMYMQSNTNFKSKRKDAWPNTFTFSFIHMRKQNLHVLSKEDLKCISYRTITDFKRAFMSLFV